MKNNTEQEAKKSLTFADSFHFAASGLMYALRHERNLRFHFIFALVVLAMALVCGFSALEICFLALTIGFVIIAEMLNTAVEKMVDYVSPQWSANAKIAKDVAAGAVLVSAFFAAVVGLVLFLRPQVIHRILNFFQ